MFVVVLVVFFFFHVTFFWDSVTNGAVSMWWHQAGSVAAHLPNDFLTAARKIEGKVAFPWEKDAEAEKTTDVYCLLLTHRKNVFCPTTRFVTTLPRLSCSTSTTTTSTARRRSLCAAGMSAPESRSPSRRSTCWWSTWGATPARSRTNARWELQWQTSLSWCHKVHRHLCISTVSDIWYGLFLFCWYHNSVHLLRFQTNINRYQLIRYMQSRN